MRDGEEHEIEKRPEGEILCGEGSGEEEEGRKPNMLANSVLPSRRKVDEHMATHIRYRSWCPSCVMGRGRNTQHFKKSMDDVAARGPQISADYGFLGAEGETRKASEKKGPTPVLVMKDRGSAAVMCMAWQCRRRERTQIGYRSAARGG